MMSTSRPAPVFERAPPVGKPALKTKTQHVFYLKPIFRVSSEGGLPQSEVTLAPEGAQPEQTSNMEKGWIKVSRNILQWQHWGSGMLLQTFLALILMANSKNC